MNKKLALKISKHPLIKKLMEDRTIPNSVIANLIVEEMIYEQDTPSHKEVLQKYQDVVANLKEEDWISVEKLNKMIKG